MKLFIATSAAAVLAFTACQKQDAASPIAAQMNTSVKPDLANTSNGPGADHVRWDIISIDATVTPATASAGGVAYASAISGNVLIPDFKIKFTGSGTFVAPTSGGISGAVTGGGTWETFTDGVSTGKGTYTVTKLVSWVFANLQLRTLTDLIASSNQVPANGTAVLTIEYSDGSQGILGIGCHGPGAPAGSEEGVIATKGYFTYWTGEVPGPLTVNKDRTIFHIPVFSK